MLVSRLDLQCLNLAVAAFSDLVELLLSAVIIQTLERNELCAELLNIHNIDIIAAAVFAFQTPQRRAEAMQRWRT